MDVRIASSAFRYSLIIASWIISMTFASAQLYLRDINTIEGMRICGNRSDVQNWNAYVYFLFISLYLVPLIVMTVSYVIIIIIIWRKGSMKIKDGSTSERRERSRLRRFFSSKKSTLSDDQQIETRIRDVRSLGVIPRAKIKTVKMTLVIVIAFTACWSPYFILTIMNTLGFIQDFVLIRVTSSLCYMNSLANPLIYWLFATNFCLRFRGNHGRPQVTKTKSTSNVENARRSSLSDRRQSVNSVKYQRRRSEDHHRAHHPRIPTPTAPLPHHSKYRLPTLNHVQGTTRLIQQQNLPASSILYGHQHHSPI
ncbi:unnamed protein product [Adineta ricciae]|uniref:G-protein coupled receptors family 1 profile domain-containing protein n=1 Tax=Adineta ricciae TaxID=249248 RepID=A0A816FVT3_ADIRI|nr:unnamed protein product [Adineta ricciae]